MDGWTDMKKVQGVLNLVVFLMFLMFLDFMGNIWFSLKYQASSETYEKCNWFYLKWH